ncbi:hypothetical protein [Winogradskyella sp.]|uniref:hypothetical protein n=1 Tax=Winogradskyella sp. TaxID=1883156 RepID=UPI003BABC4B6
MDKNLALFNQINSLSYWLLKESHYKSTVTLDATDDSFFISVKNGIESIYKHHIEDFSKKDEKYLNFELSSIAHHLLHIKRSITSRSA